MRTNFLNTTILLLFLSTTGYSQDIHWSQVNRQPLYQNPGNTGLFEGDLRLTGNYKDQWRNVSVPFSTFALGIDGKWKQKGISFGGLLFHDQVGDGKFTTFELQLSASKQFKLTGDSVHCLSFGIQAGVNYRQINMSKFYFDNQFNGIFFDPTLPTQESFMNDSQTNASLATGAVYTWNRAKEEQLIIGLGGFNLNRPNQGFYGQQVKRDMRISLFGTYIRPVNSDWAVLPGFSFNVQGVYRELVLGGQARYTLINRLGAYRAIDGGIWFRNRDAIIIRGGVAIQNWSVGISYDTNVSKLIPASKLRGGLELSAHYIITRFRPEKVIHRICPDYI